jgi:hypothetical protein
MKRVALLSDTYRYLKRFSTPCLSEWRSKAAKKFAFGDPDFRFEESCDEALRIR